MSNSGARKKAPRRIPRRLVLRDNLEVRSLRKPVEAKSVRQVRRKIRKKAKAKVAPKVKKPKKKTKATKKAPRSLGSWRQPV